MEGEDPFHRFDDISERSQGRTGHEEGPLNVHAGLQSPAPGADMTDESSDELLQSMGFRYFQRNGIAYYDHFRGFISGIFPSSPHQSHPGGEQPDRRLQPGSGVHVNVPESSAEGLPLHENAPDGEAVRTVIMRRDEGAEEFIVTSPNGVARLNVAAVNDASAEDRQEFTWIGAGRISLGEGNTGRYSEVFNTTEANAQVAAGHTVNQWTVQRNDVSQLMVPPPGETIGGGTSTTTSNQTEKNARRAKVRKQLRNSTKYRCPKCYLGHDCHSKLTKHLESVHPESDLVEAFRCQICLGDSYFKSKASLTKHMKRQHRTDNGGDRP